MPCTSATVNRHSMNQSCELLEAGDAEGAESNERAAKLMKFYVSWAQRQRELTDCADVQ